MISNKVLDSSTIHQETEMLNSTSALNTSAIPLVPDTDKPDTENSGTADGVADDRMQVLFDKIHEKTSHYDKNATRDIYKGKDGLGYFEISFRYATTMDKVLFGITASCIFFYGATRPLFGLMFGQVSGNVNNAAHGSETKTWEAPLQMVAVGAFGGLFRTIQVYGLERFAWSMAHQIKVNYFRAILGKDSTWFDSHNPNELSSKLVKESQMIYRGIGEKVGDLYGVGSQMIVAFLIAFTMSW